MKQLSLALLLPMFLAGVALDAQSDAGLESPAEARAILNAEQAQCDQLRPILATLNPQAWYEKKGAPGSYVIQWQTASRELSDVDAAAKLFGAKIDSLDAALDWYFRLEALETTARSLNEGAQRYAERPQADQLASFVAHSFDDRQRLRDYLRDLTGSLEQNYKIADGEAQRCRAEMSKQSPCVTAPRKGKRS